MTHQGSRVAWFLLFAVLHSGAFASGELPALTTRHLAAMSDEHGISEFARGTVPMKHRYCIEDTARALVAVLRMHALEPGDETERLARMYLRAIDELRTEDGGIWFGFDREGPLAYRASGDQLTRTLWGLGHASVHGVDDGMRTHAQRLFEEVLPLIEDEAYDGPIRLTYELQGLSLFLQVQPDHPAAKRMLEQTAILLLEKMPKDHAASWQWPSDVVTYDSARFPLALLLASETTGDPRLQEAGLRVLRFLATVNFPGDGKQFQAVGNQGWYRKGEAMPGFAQQPLDATAMVEACAAAWRLTGDELWKQRAQTAFAWFTGNNSLQVPMADSKTGGCHDGLNHGGRNHNQGAESTVSYWIARCVISACGRM